jgi:hypothetical protein
VAVVAVVVGRFRRDILAALLRTAAGLALTLTLQPVALAL